MLLGYNIFRSNLSDINFSKVKVINTINPHSYCIAKRDKVFREALETSDLLLPDGIGIVMAEKFLNNNKIQKIAGYDLFEFLMKKNNQEKGSVFFLGASEKTLLSIEKRAMKDYPNVNVNFYSPPYKSGFSEEDSRIMCDKVNQVKPDVLFVGMTAPKQEKWVYEYKDRLNAKVICSIGAVFDFYGGNVKRAPKIIIKLGLEWAHRSILSFRLFKRNFKSNPIFVKDMIMLKLKKNCN